MSESGIARRALTTVCLAAWLSACGGGDGAPTPAAVVQPPTPAPLPAPQPPAVAPPAGIPASGPLSFVVIGASTSACKNLVEGGYTLSDCWVNRFAAYLQATRPGSSVVNLAVSGTGSCHALPSSGTIPAACPVVDPHPIPDAQNNITQALSRHPQGIIVNYPGEYGLGVDLLIANYQQIQDAATAAGVPVWFTTSQPAIEDLAQRDLRLLQRDRVQQAFAPRVLDFFTPLADASNMTAPAYVNAYDHAHPNAEGHRLLFEAAKSGLGL